MPSPRPNLPRSEGGGCGSSTTTTLCGGEPESCVRREREGCARREREGCVRGGREGGGGEGAPGAHAAGRRTAGFLRGRPSTNRRVVSHRSRAARSRPSC